MRAPVLTLLSFSMLPPLVAQQVEWVAPFAGGFNTIGQVAGVVADGAGNAYVGSAYQPETTYLTGYDPLGQPLWTSAVALSFFVEARTMAATPDGNIVVGGILENNTGTYDMTVLKYDTQGDTLWSFVYNSPGTFTMDELFGMGVDALGNVYGGGYSSNGSQFRYRLFKLDPDGALQWTQEFTNGGTCTGRNLYVSPAGDACLIGFCSSGGTVNYLLKYDTGGNLQWSKPGVPFSEATGHRMLDDGNGQVYVAGEWYPPGAEKDVRLELRDTNGDTVWTRSFDVGDSSRVDYHVDMERLANGDVVELAKSTAGLSQVIALRRYTPTGQVVWTSVYGNDSTSVEPYDLLVGSNGHLYVSGRSATYTSLLLELDDAGNLLNVVDHDVPGYQLQPVEHLCEAPGGRILGTGRMRLDTAGTFFRAVTLSYANGVPTVVGAAAEAFGTVRVYPDPGTDRIAFSGLGPDPVEVRIHDLRGALVLAPRHLRSGQELDVHALAPGLYTVLLRDARGDMQRVRWVKE